MRLAVWVMSVLFTGLVQAQTLHLQSGVERAQVVELYTSEGCSSCPPAEKFLNAYRRDPRLWRQVIPLAFHVDYWDYLGWRDRYDSPDYSRRQRDYARHWRMNTVYTPALFVNGAPWRNWRWGHLPDNGDQAVGRLEVVVDGDRLEGRFEASRSGVEAEELHVAILGMGLVSEIRAGENRGRTAHHEFVVLAHKRYSGEDGHWQGQLPTPSLKAARYAVVAWVGRRGDPTPLQAVGAYLP
jgi:hypothetical protein